jgi:hypothetical protein
MTEAQDRPTLTPGELAQSLKQEGFIIPPPRSEPAIVATPPTLAQRLADLSDLLAGPEGVITRLGRIEQKTDDAVAAAKGAALAARDCANAALALHSDTIAKSALIERMAALEGRLDAFEREGTSLQ